nr:sensor protein kdpD domain protein [Rhodococcus sp. JVH1]
MESLGGTFHHVVGDDVPNALLEFARGVNATQLVIGASRRGRIAQIFSRGVGVEVTALSGSIDVHMVTHEATKQGRHARLSALTRRRRAAGFVIALVEMPPLSIVLANLRAQLSLPSDILIFLIGVVGVALAGGLWPALVARATWLRATELLLHSAAVHLHHRRSPEVLALLVDVLIAIAVSTVVDRAARRTREGIGGESMEYGRNPIRAGLGVRGRVPRKPRPPSPPRRCRHGSPMRPRRPL